MLVISCKHCGINFPKKIKHQKYCSVKCREEGKKKRKRTLKICTVCEMEFVASSNKVTFCSISCASMANGRRIKAICDYCKKEFYKKQSHVEMCRNNFCSKECHNKSMEQKVAKECEFCGKKFLDVPNIVNKRTYCSNECKNSAKKQSISYETIYSLYVNKKMSTREMADNLSVSKHKIADAVKYYGLPMKSVPSKQELEKLYVDDYMPYSEIAGIYSVDSSSVGHWLKRYDIQPRKSRKGKDFIMPTYKEAFDLYVNNGMSTGEMGDMFNTSSGTISKILKGYNIQVRASGYKNTEQIICSDGHVVKSRLEQIVDDYLSENGFRHEYDKRLPKPFNLYKTDFYCNGYYVEVWGITGNAKYLNRRKVKEGAYRKLKLSLISIEPEDFKNIENVYIKIKSIPK